MSGSASILANYRLTPGQARDAVTRRGPTVAMATVDRGAAAQNVTPAVAKASDIPPRGAADGLRVALVAQLRAHGRRLEEIEDDDVLRHWQWAHVLLDMWNRGQRATPPLTEVEMGRELLCDACRRRHGGDTAPVVGWCPRAERTGAPGGAEACSPAYFGSYVSKKVVTARKWSWPPRTEAECREFMRDFHGHSRRKSVAEQTPEERQRTALQGLERNARKACELGCSRDEIQKSVDAGIRSAGDLPSAATHAARLGCTGENAC